MKRLLIPMDGSERSRNSVQLVKSLYQPGDVKIVVMEVWQINRKLESPEAIERMVQKIKDYLNEIAKELKGYEVTIKIAQGQAGEEILKAADELGTDLIVMTKSTKKGWTQTIGSVTAYCVKYAKCIVVIAPENNKE